ncbi:MAG: hypothetical protein SH850_30495 [Planctomycetaceae bacterium]|nr:hypothetical protein [Planctomycetaceae bacterium]
MRVLTLSCLLLTWTNNVLAQFDNQPTQQVLRAAPNGDWWLYNLMSTYECKPETYAVTVKVPVQVTKEFQENGQTVQKTVTEVREESKTETRMLTQMVCRQFNNAVHLESVKAFETDGRKITLADLKQRVTGDTLVLTSTSEEMIPDYYASLFKPGTIILCGVVPGCAPGSGAILPAPQRAQPVPTGLQSFDSSPSPFRFVTYAPADLLVGPPQLPSTPAPQMVFAARDGADAVKIRRFSETKVDSEVTVKVNDSSVSPEKMVKVQSTERHSTTATVPWNALRFSTGDSKDLPADRVKERLGAGEATVLMSANGKLVDEFWLQNIKPNVLVLRGIQFSPAMSSGYGGYPAPAPAMAPAPPAESQPVSPKNSTAPQPPREGP